ncbi:hypothetical protein GVO57_02855 [Sphingomonas changnyeongensis]|uniref:Uncharacterized protein n=1 Tax=Sphingomonas changnyeongensis TaxID=2698679 RepID=A0A7Z2NUB4_9SPHN|nr:hypothetical protein [Sphingomonas changnyeongensis]QHL89958.1 hypothetical protein GVO57_02855 [Sphingomonas changnyeongensis]
MNGHALRIGLSGPPLNGRWPPGAGLPAGPQAIRWRRCRVRAADSVGLCRTISGIGTARLRRPVMRSIAVLCLDGDDFRQQMNASRRSPLRAVDILFAMGAILGYSETWAHLWLCVLGTSGHRPVRLF